jgi:hypothetical protein
VLLAASFFYWQEYRNPFDFKIELIDEFNLVEVKEKINDLKIIYQKDDILEAKKEIKVVRIKVSNKGETILQNLYDQLVEFGLRFSEAKILSAEIIDTNSSNLKGKLIKKMGGNTENYDDLIFSKVIFDKGDFATIKVILIQPAKEKLSITPLGKLANIKELQIDKIKIESEEKTSFPWWYVAIGYVGLLVFLFGLIFIIDFLDERKKKKKIKLYEKKHGEFDGTQLKIVQKYLKFGSKSENLVKAILDNDFALDLKVYIEKETDSLSFFKLFLPLTFGQKIRFQTLAKDIFVVDGVNVTFNQENETFIKSFFGEVL